MQTLLQDIRYGIRMLAKNPGFTIVAVLTLALGIGANTALFSVVNGVLLNALPFRQPDHLVALYANRVQFQRASISYPNFLDWQLQNRTFDSMAAFRPDDFNLTGAGEAEHIRGEMVSADFFSTLGVQPTIGRWFTSQEDQIGGAPVVIISASLWTRKFGSRPDIAGRSVALNGTRLHDHWHRSRNVPSANAEFSPECRSLPSHRPVERRDLSRSLLRLGHEGNWPA